MLIVDDSPLMAKVDDGNLIPVNEFRGDAADDELPLLSLYLELLAGVEGVKGFEAEMVLRPPWTPEMMSEEAKAALGFF